jgi:hypothetical protein
MSRQPRNPVPPNTATVVIIPSGMLGLVEPGSDAAPTCRGPDIHFFREADSWVEAQFESAVANAFFA